MVEFTGNFQYQYRLYIGAKHHFEQEKS